MPLKMIYGRKNNVRKGAHYKVIEVKESRTHSTSCPYIETLTIHGYSHGKSKWTQSSIKKVFGELFICVSTVLSSMLANKKRSLSYGEYVQEEGDTNIYTKL